MIIKISRNDNGHVYALATIHKANCNRVISVTILMKSSSEKTEKIVENIGKVASL